MSTDFCSFAERIGLVRSLLVVAPHPDDETLGCGGLVALASAAGCDVSVVVVTDGAASHVHSRTWPPLRLARQRRSEVVGALRILGVERPPVFLNLPDARTQELSLPVVSKVRDTLAACIVEHRAEAVFTTWRREPHCDHRFAYTLTLDALRAVSASIALVEYMVWTPIAGSPEDHPRPFETEQIGLDIRPVREAKIAAVQAHKSQLGHLIEDDPTGFTLSTEHLTAMTGPYEQFACTR